MFWTSLGIACLDLVRALVEFALTWLVQSTMLIGAGLALAWVLWRLGAVNRLPRHARRRCALSVFLLVPLGRRHQRLCL